MKRKVFFKVFKRLTLSLAVVSVTTITTYATTLENAKPDNINNIINTENVEKQVTQKRDIHVFPEMSRTQQLERLELLKSRGIEVVSPEIDFSLGASNINILSLDTGRLESFDSDGLVTVTYLEPVEVEQKLIELAEERAFNTGFVNVFVPRNVTGNEGTIVGGQYGVVAPHNFVNLQTTTLPMQMSTINISIVNELGDDLGWAPNIRDNQIAWMQVRFPNERYAVRVSTNQTPSVASLRAFTD